MTLYQNLQKIDEGGQAKVYLADDVQGNRKVILKVAKHDNTGSIRRLKREARLLREQAANAFAIDLFADHTDHHPPFLVLEYCSGGSLTNWVFDRKPARTVATAMRHAMLGLQGIHGRGGFHGDFTPRNLLVAQYSDGWRVKLIDLGLGQTPNPLSGSMTRDFRGTPNYIAPEVEKGDDYTWRADIFSAGIVLRELLTGVRMKLAFTFNPAPQALGLLVDRMTSENPLLRPTTAQVINELEAFLAKPLPQPMTLSDVRPSWTDLIVPAAAVLLGILATKNRYDSQVGRYRNHKGQFASGWFG
jgi:eukaryotic-like serine/threonine-protein kinase